MTDNKMIEDKEFRKTTTMINMMAGQIFKDNPELEHIKLKTIIKVDKN